MDVNGTAGTPAQLEHNVLVTSPGITGDLTRLYVVYRKGTEDKIRTKYSYDGGISWSYLLPDLDPDGTPSSIECVFVRNQLHITYLVGTDVYHSFYDLEVPEWKDPHEVYPSGPTSDPRITAWNEQGNEQVFITYMNGRDFRWTRYNVNNPGYSNTFFHTGGDYDINLGIGVDDQYVYGLWKEQTTNFLKWMGKYWSYQGSILNGSQNNNIFISKIFTTETADNRAFSACWYGDATTGYIARLFFDHSEGIFYDEIYSDPNLTPVGIVNLSAAGNEVHVVWKDNLGTNNGNNLRYKYYDDVPVPPQNLTIVKSQNNHPLLSWIDPNPDGSYYKIFRINACGGNWQQIATASDLDYEDESLSYCTAIPPEECEEECAFHYKVTVVDVGNKESDYSNIVWARLAGGGKPQKIGANDSDDNLDFEYLLDQNYPNPFNPTTNISYSIKNSDLVTFKVFDVLGSEVATLVNEIQPAGKYTVSFDASELPSGVYIYKLQAGIFVETKKMILLK